MTNATVSLPRRAPKHFTRTEVTLAPHRFIYLGNDRSKAHAAARAFRAAGAKVEIVVGRVPKGFGSTHYTVTAYGLSNTKLDAIAAKHNL